LRDNQHFKNATLKKNQEIDEEIVEFAKFENTGSLIFSLFFKAALSGKLTGEEV
jgi:hypothetical protein